MNTSIEVGQQYLIRTVTMFMTGRIKQITETDLLLEDAAWVADTGRWYNALKDGVLSEVEPYPDGCIVSRAAIVDVSPWNHPLPSEQQ
jgi:hypothetical protein